MEVYENIKETFALKDLDEDFYNKVIFIYKRHSTGLGGPGCLIMITEDNKEYYIGFEAINKNDNRYDDSGIDEYNLEEYIPILKSKLIKEDGNRIKYDIEDNGWVNANKMLIRQDYFEKIKDVYEEKKKYKYFFPLMIGNILVDKNKEPQRIYYHAYKKYIENEIETEKEYIADLIEEKDLKWEKYYINNYCNEDSDNENGFYCLLFNEEVAAEADIHDLIGHRWLIKYQFNDNEEYSLDYKTGKTELIKEPDAYNLYYKRYPIVAGKMEYPASNLSRQDIDELEYLVFNNYDLSYGQEGSFIKSYRTLDEAKQAVVRLNMKAAYGTVLKSNSVYDYSSKIFELQQKLQYLEPFYLLDEKYDEILKVLKKNKDDNRAIIDLRYKIMDKFVITYYNAERLLKLFSSNLTNTELSKYSNEYRRIKKEIDDNYPDIYLGEVNDIF